MPLTKQDIKTIEEIVAASEDRTKDRFNSLESRFTAIDKRFDSIDQRFDEFEKLVGENQQEILQAIEKVVYLPMLKLEKRVAKLEEQMLAR